MSRPPLRLRALIAHNDQRKDCEPCSRSMTLLKCSRRNVAWGDRYKHAGESGRESERAERKRCPVLLKRR